MVTVRDAVLKSSDNLALGSKLLLLSLQHECIQYNRLIAAISSSVAAVAQSSSGLSTSTEDIDLIREALEMQRVPASWHRYGYISDCTALKAWLDGLIERVAYLQTWISDGKPAASIWISAFLFPNIIATAALANVPEKPRIGLTSYKLSCIVQDEARQIKETPMTGLYIHGLKLNCANWDNDHKVLMDQTRKCKFFDGCSVFPSIHLKPIAITESEHTMNYYRCPVFKSNGRATSTREGDLCSDFIMWLNLPAGARDQDYWAKASVALVCSD